MHIHLYSTHFVCNNCNKLYDAGQMICLEDLGDYCSKECSSFVTVHNCEDTYLHNGKMYLNVNNEYDIEIKYCPFCGYKVMRSEKNGIHNE